MPVDAPAPTLEPRTFEAKARTQSSSRASTATLRAGPAIRQVALVVDPTQLRLAHYELTGRLAAESGVCVTTIRGRSREPLPRSAELLLELERAVSRCPARD